jgi:hypothetical protein
MAELNEVVAIGAMLVLFAAAYVGLRHPVWIHHVLYRWTALWMGPYMAAARREDMNLLFRDPGGWASTHRAEVRWTRFSVGCGALIVGTGALLVGLMVLTSR